MSKYIHLLEIRSFIVKCIPDGVAFPHRRLRISKLVQSPSITIRAEAKAKTTFRIVNAVVMRHLRSCQQFGHKSVEMLVKDNLLEPIDGGQMQFGCLCF